MRRVSRKLSITTVVAIAALSLSAVALGAAPLSKTSHAHYWYNTPGSVFCGYRSGHKTQLACRGTNIPGGGVKKCSKPGTFAPAYAVLASHGKTQVVVTCKAPWPKTAHFAVLPGGTTWSGLGITCKLTGTDGKTATCTNKSHHGFVTGNGKYKSF